MHAEDIIPNLSESNFVLQSDGISEVSESVLRSISLAGDSHWNLLLRVSRAPPGAPVAAEIGRRLAAGVAELGAARAFDVVASFYELNGLRAGRANLIFLAALVGIHHLLLVILGDLTRFLAVVVFDSSQEVGCIERRSAEEAVMVVAFGVFASTDGDEVFTVTRLEDATGELATGAVDAVSWEDRVLELFLHVFLEEFCVQQVCVVERI